jgi:DNA-binding NarL/FixJ family response regulator
MTVRIVLADDQPLVRAGLRMVIADAPDLEIVGEAGTGTEAVRIVRELRPDVVVMDIRMPGMDGIEATRMITANAPAPRVLMLTTFDDDTNVYAALRAGASGFLLKDAPPEQLVAGIRTIAIGESLLAPSITRRLIEGFINRPAPSARDAPDLEDLTPRELEVLALIGRGRSNSEIARQLVVSEATVKTHVAHVFSKLDLRDRAQAVVVAYETGLVQPGG